jgi:hypothetical protein
MAMTAFFQKNNFYDFKHTQLKIYNGTCSRSNKSKRYMPYQNPKKFAKFTITMKSWNVIMIVHQY